MTEPTGFAVAAAAGLAPVAQEVAAVKASAQSGTLKMTEDAARYLLDSLAEAKRTVAELLGQRYELDAPLQFGANFVGRAMSDRLRNAASGAVGAAIPVLDDLSRVLDDLETTVLAAAGRYTAVNEEAERKLRDAKKRLGI